MTLKKKRHRETMRLKRELGLPLKTARELCRALERGRYDLVASLAINVTVEDRGINADGEVCFLTTYRFPKGKLENLVF